MFKFLQTLGLNYKKLQTHKSTYNHQYQYQDKQAEKQKQKQREWIQNMFQQIIMNVNQLLENLSYIYQSHCVEYNVRGFEDAVIRLLSPVELLAQFNNYRRNYGPKTYGSLWESNLYKSFNSKKNQFQNVNKYPIKIQHNEKYTNKQKPTTPAPISHQTKTQNSIVSKNSSFQAIQQSQNKNNTYNTYNEQNQNDYNFQNGLNSRTSLNPQEEQQICNWLKQQVQSGKIISKSDIMRQAKNISRNPTFQASTGWCRRFLMRNQDAKILLQMNRFVPQMQMQKIQNARLQRSIRFQKLKQKHQQNKQKQINKNAEQSSHNYWEPIYMNQPFQQIPRNDSDQENKQSVYEEQESEQNEQPSKTKNNKQKQNSIESDKSSKSPQFQQIVNKLQFAVRGHKEAMLYSTNPKQKNTDILKQNILKKMNENAERSSKQN